MRRLSLLLFIIIGLTSVAQQTNLSPYSRIGLGDPDPNSFVNQFGMAGTGIALVDGIHLNPQNPAAQTFLRSPAFEVGLKSERLTVNSETESSTNSTTRLNHFAVGFPMWKGKWGVSFGISPFTTIGYNNVQQGSGSAIDTAYTNEYRGSGGLNRMFLDLSRKFTFNKDTSKYKQHDHIAIGARLDYLFGSISSERSTIFPLNSGYMSTRIEDATTMNDVSMSSGVLMRYYLDRKKGDEDHRYSILNIGATYSPEIALAGSRSRDAYSFIQNASEVTFEKDSIQSFSDQKGTIRIPGSFGVGASFELYMLNTSTRTKLRRFVIAADIKMSDWSVVQEDFNQVKDYTGLGKSMTYSTGIAYKPMINSRQGSRVNVFQLTEYRVGFRTGDSHLKIDGETLTESGMSFGMSIPMLIGGFKYSDSQLDFGVEYSQRGTKDSGLLQEDYLRVMVGFSFHPDARFDQWFRKRKYD